MLQYRYPNLFKAPQLSHAKALLAKPLESYSYSLAEEKLCMSRLITYASDEGKSYPMLIGAEYNEETRSQMALFLVGLQFIIKTSIAHHNNIYNLYSCASIYAITIRRIALSCRASSSPFHGTYPSNMALYLLKTLRIYCFWQSQKKTMVFECFFFGGPQYLV